MRRYISYFTYVLKHKWYVLLEGRKLNIPLWRLVIHDWDKFLPGMFISYAKTFRTPDGKEHYTSSDDFRKHADIHVLRNKHHWNYWVLVWDVDDHQPQNIPETHLREMIADWRGAGRALGKPDTKAWYILNREKVELSEQTRMRVEQLLGVE
jgi:hypothetical protein